MQLLILDQIQARRFRKWKNIAVKKNKYWNSWKDDGIDGHKKIHKLIKDTDFLKGNNLNENDFKNLFSYLQQGMGNRAFNKNLYINNNYEILNKKLRTLLKNPELFPISFDDIILLNGIGVWSASQLLCKWSPENFPFIATSGGKGFMDQLILNHIDYQQLQVAEQYAKQTYGNIWDQISSKTRYYLTCCILFDEIREAMDLSSFLEVQNVLWYTFDNKTYRDKPIKKRKTIISIESIAESSLAAMQKVINYEISQNRIPKDVSNQVVGYDIYSVDTLTGEYRYIEVKSRKYSTKITLTNNEYVSARRYKSKYYLYVISNDDDCWMVCDPINTKIIKKIQRTEWEIINWKEDINKFKIQ